MSEGYWRSSRDFRGYWDPGFPEQRPPWGIIEVLLVIALVFLLLLPLRLFGSHWLIPLAVALFPGYSKPSLSLQLFLGLVQTLLMIGLVLGTARLRSRTPWKLLGFQGFSWRSVWLFGILGGLAVFISIVVAMTLISALWHLPVPSQEAGLPDQQGKWLAGTPGYDALD